MRKAGERYGRNSANPMRIRYPAFDQITDPTPRLPAAVVSEIQSVITQTIARWRSDKKSPQGHQIESWEQDAVLIFNLLARGRLEQNHPHVEALREVLNQDAELTLDCIHWIYRQAFRGRMALYYGHQQIEMILDDAAEAIVTEWWVAQAGARSDPK